MKGQGLLAAATLILVSSFLASSAATGATVSELEKALMCVCGCNMTLSSCQCSKADQMRADLSSRISKGATPGEILKAYVDMYGEKVLSSPPKRGFNLTAWIIPFVGIASGLFLLGYVLRRLVRTSGERDRHGPSPAGDGTPVLRENRERIEEELKRYI